MIYGEGGMVTSGPGVFLMYVVTFMGVGTLAGIVLAIVAYKTVGLGNTLNDFFTTEAAAAAKKEGKPVEVVAVSESEQNPRSLDKDDMKLLNALLKKHAADSWGAKKCLATTFIGWSLSLYLLHTYQSWWAVILMGCCVVRCFIMFHDACHLSFFADRKANGQLAWLLSMVSPQSQGDWTASHNQHHSHLGDSSFLDLSLTIWFNKQEYKDMGLLLGTAYRLIRDPILLPGIISAYQFWLYPLVNNTKETLTNRLPFYVPLVLLLGWKTALLYVVSAWVAGIIGIQLFHLQHQCNTPYRVQHNDHSSWDAGMAGSTHLHVAFPFTYATMGIEYHHIHHASTRVPGYNLAACHAEGMKHGLWEKAGVMEVGPKKAFLSLFHSLFEDNKLEEEGKPPPKFVSFDFYQALGLHD